MRRFIIFTLLLVMPYTLSAQDSGDKSTTKMEYVVSAGVTHGFEMPYYSSAPGINHRYESHPGHVIAFEARAIINDNLRVGGEFSISHFYTGDWTRAPHWVQFNFAPTIKGVLPLRGGCSLFANASIGATATMMVSWGLYLNGGIGVEYERFVASLGYRAYANRAMSINEERMRLVNSVYLQLGVRLGKR